MAYRKIHDDFWTDPDIEELTPEQKFFYLYLLTNPNVNQIGLYEFSIKRACFETGYNTDTVCKLLNTFEEMGKIKRSTETKEILVIKFYWHNKSNSPKVVKHVEGLLKEVKDTSLIQYIYGMGTASQEEEAQEEENKKNNREKNNVPALSQVVSYFSENNSTKDEAEKFYDYYQSKGWKIKGDDIQDWKACVRTWIRRDYDSVSKSKTLSYKEMLDKCDKSHLTTDDFKMLAKDKWVRK